MNPIATNPFIANDRQRLSMGRGEGGEVRGRGRSGGEQANVAEDSAPTARQSFAMWAEKERQQESAGEWRGVGHGGVLRNGEVGRSWESG